jgi:hypothetical protein
MSDPERHSLSGMIGTILATVIEDEGSGPGSEPPARWVTSPLFRMGPRVRKNAECRPVGRHHVDVLRPAVRLETERPMLEQSRLQPVTTNIS